MKIDEIVLQKLKASGVIKMLYKQNSNEKHLMVLCFELPKLEMNYGFTIGMKTLYGLPELMIVGPSNEYCRQYLLCASLVLSITKRKYKNGTVLNDIIPQNILEKFKEEKPKCLSLALIDVEENYKFKLMEEVKAAYGDWDFEAQQVVVPDINGNFPWDKNYINEVMDRIQFMTGNIENIA